MRLARSFLVSVLSAALLVSVSAASVAAAGATIYVDDDGQGQADSCSGDQDIPSTIQGAIGISSPGDRIIVCPGTYVGRVLLDVPRVTVRGLDPWTSIVQPAPDHPVNNALFLVTNAPGAKVKWLRFQALTAEPCEQVGAMIGVSNSPRAEIRANKIEIAGTQGLDGCGYTTGVRVVGNSQRAYVLWNTITDFKDEGIDLLDSPDLLVRGNTINWYHAAHDAGDAETDLSTGINMNGDVPGVRINDNVIRGLPSGGDSTPEFVNGIAGHMTPALIKMNKIRYVNDAIELLSVDGATIRENVAQVGVGDGIGIFFGDGSNVWGNVVAATGTGMYISSGSAGNTVHENDFRGPSDPDCADDSTDGGTSGTANWWMNNLGTSDPAGLCTEP